jgi:LDH2 family malate/lactate/ureidoglycolate dehydrogenase
MVRWFERAGLPVPEHWALTAEGERTTDPSAAMEGPLLPVGDYKGYGLSLITDVLTGVMTGSLFGGSVFQDDRNYDVGHTMIAVDPEVFLPRGEFAARLERLLDEVKKAPPIDADSPVQLPGEAEQERARQRLSDGIPVDVETVKKLETLSQELGISFNLSEEHS